jgi:hypothetical protein
MAIFQPQADTDPRIVVIFCCDALKSRRRTLKEGHHCFEKVALTVNSDKSLILPHCKRHVGELN